MAIEPALNDARRRLKDGVRIAGTLLAAAAVMRLLARALGLPLRDWLAAILGAYADLMHPIVAYTVGFVPLLFGYELLPAAKDAIILYALLSGSLYRAAAPFAPRAWHIEGEWRTDPTQLARTFLISLLWPLILPAIASRQRMVRRRRKNLWKYQHIMTTETIRQREVIMDEMEEQRLRVRDFFRELAYVAAIVAVCVLLNAAGVIGLPD